MDANYLAVICGRQSLNDIVLVAYSVYITGAIN